MLLKSCSLLKLLKWKYRNEVIQMRVNALFHLFNNFANEAEQCKFHTSPSAKLSFGQCDGVDKVAMAHST